MRVSIADIQRFNRGARRGTIRCGEEVDGKARRRETFLVTSPDKAVLDGLVSLFSSPGEVVPWGNAKSDDTWALETGTTELRVLLSAHGDPLSQRYEMWGSGGRLRDCDGTRCSTVDAATGEMVESDCLCSDEKPDCKLTTRLTVVLRDAPTFGSFLLTTGSVNAAYELPYAVAMLTDVSNAGGMTVPAILRLEPRTKKKQGEKFTRSFAVPVLDIDPAEARGQIGAPPAPLGITEGDALTGEVEEPDEAPSTEDAIKSIITTHGVTKRAVWTLMQGLGAKSLADVTEQMLSDADKHFAAIAPTPAKDDETVADEAWAASGRREPDDPEPVHPPIKGQEELA